MTAYYLNFINKNKKSFRVRQKSIKNDRSKQYLIVFFEVAGEYLIDNPTFILIPSNT
jgi:hypothetical protein